MTARVGDKILIESKKVLTPGRAGVIEDVLREDPPRYQVRWDDGRTTIFTPAAGVARIEATKKKQAVKKTTQAVERTTQAVKKTTRKAKA